MANGAMFATNGSAIVALTGLLVVRYMDRDRGTDLFYFFYIII
jgi:hypothetical protein